MSWSIDPDLIEVVRSGDTTNWGNVFLTSGWVLYLDMRNRQHDLAMEQLGIDRHSVLLSVAVHATGQINFRSSPGRDRGDITVDEDQQLMLIVKQIIREQLVEVN